MPFIPVIIKWEVKMQANSQAVIKSTFLTGMEFDIDNPERSRDMI